MILPEMVAALERASADALYRPTTKMDDVDRASQSRNDAAALAHLASLLKGAQEAWQHQNDPEAIHLIEDDDEPSDWSPDYRRIYIVPAEEEQ